MPTPVPTPPSQWLEQVLKDTYRIDRLIGEGGTGLVYEAYHLRLRVKVAIKLLRQNAGPVAFARFRKEAEITARLRHPNIVQVLDYDVTPDGHAYLVTEWLDGETLAANLRQGGAMDPRTAVTILRPVCDAVAAAHAAGVVHRDLKPANLFLARPPTGTGPPLVKVLDFGIAKLTERDPVSTEQGQTLGTPRYMSPEQIRIDAGDEVGPASDQFSLGTIAYELVAGRPAFPGSAHAAMLAVLNNQPEPLPAYVPAGYREAVARAMSSRPQDRFPGVAEFIQALEEGVFAEPPPPAPVPLRALWLGGLGLCGVLLLLIIWAQGSRETPPRPPAPAPDLVRAAAPVPPAPVAVPLPADDAAEPDPAAGGPRVRTVEVRGLPEGAQLFLNGKLVHGRTLRLPVGVPVRLRAVPRRGSCYEGRELVYTPPPDRLPPPLVMELPRDKDCPFY